jgi:hypothetical protein
MEKLPHQELERLPLTRKQSQYVLTGVSLRAELTPLRLNNRSTIAQISYRAAQELSAEGGRP